MLLSDFKARIQAHSNKGTTLVGEIPYAIAEAVDWIESNYTLEYQKQFVSVVLPAGASSLAVSNFISGLPGAKRLKAIRWLRRGRVSGATTQWIYLPKIEPTDRVSGEASDRLPSGFWVVGGETLVFDNSQDQALALEAEISVFSDWSTVSDGSTHWLLQNASRLLLAQTMLFLAPYMREPGLRQLYQAEREEQARLLGLAQDEAQFSGTDMRMLYE